MRTSPSWNIAGGCRALEFAWSRIGTIGRRHQVAGRLLELVGTIHGDSSVCVLCVCVRVFRRRERVLEASPVRQEILAEYQIPC